MFSMAMSGPMFVLVPRMYPPPHLPSIDNSHSSPDIRPQIILLL